MGLRLSPVWGRRKQKASVSRPEAAALGAEENVAAAVPVHEVSRRGSEARREGGTTRTRTSAAQPQ